MTLPGVPTKAYSTVDRTRTTDEKISELRQTMFGFARSLDDQRNSVLATDLGGAKWGLSLPHVHEPCYPMMPNMGALGLTPTVAYCSAFPVLAQQVNIGVRWSVLESMLMNTAIGDFEIRWNKGLLPLGRGTGPNDSLLIDAWDSGAPGSKGAGGELVRQTTFLWPSTGPQPVGYREPGGVCVSVWTSIRSGTGMGTDWARVVPAWLYQSGVGKQG